MTSRMDIWRAAKLLVDQHGADAPIGAAQRAGLSIPTIQKIANVADGEQRGSVESVAAIERALADAGVSWRDDARQCGVSMRKAGSAVGLC